MKKVFIVVLTLLLTACTETAPFTTEEIDELIEQSEFGLPILTEVTDQIKEDYFILDGFGEFTMLPNEFDPELHQYNTYVYEYPSTKYTVTAFPDHIDGGSYVTRIVTSDPESEVFGLRIGDSADFTSIDTHLSSFGYVVDQNGLSDISFSFNNGKVRIGFYLEDGMIAVMTINIEVTNRDGIIF